jgi:hypothetical protein
VSNVARFVRKRERPVKFVHPDTKRTFDAIVRRWQTKGCKPFRVRAEELAPEVHPEDWALGNDPPFHSARNYAVYRTRIELRCLEFNYKCISTRAAGMHGKEITLTTTCRLEVDPGIAPSPVAR